MNGNQIYHGDDFIMHRNIESLRCAPGTHMVLYGSTNLQLETKTIVSAVVFITGNEMMVMAQ